MSDIQKHEQHLPQRFSNDLVKTFFNNSQNDDTIQLIIKIDEHDISVKGLSDYLHFIYKADGILSSVGFRSYSKLYDEQIFISRVEFGSIAIVLEKLLLEHGAEKLIIIGLALKYLPLIIEKGMSSTAAFYDILIKREEYLEKRNRRRERKYIRELVKEEVELLNLDSKNQEKLVDVLDEIYLKNSNKLKATGGFSKDKVKSISLTSKRKK